MATIGTLAASIALDTTKFVEGATLTRKELSLVKQVMSETQSPAQKMESAIDQLTALFNKGALTAEQFAAATDKVRQEMAGTEAQTERLSDAQRRAMQIYEQTRTPLERYEAEMRELEGLLKQGVLSTDTYRRATDRLGDELVELRTKQAAANSQISSSTGILGDFAGAIGLPLGGVAALGAAFGTAALAVKAFALDTFQSLDHLGDLGDQIGASADSMQVIAYAAELAGTNIDAVQPALARLNVVMGDAIAGNEAAAAAFKRLGLDAGELARLPLDERLAKIADAVSQLPTPAEQASAAMDLFGRGAAQLAPILAQGGDELERVRGELESMNALLTADQADAIDKADKAYTRLTQSVKASAGGIIGDFAPALEFVLNLLAKMVQLVDFLDTALGTIAPTLSAIGKTAATIAKTLGLSFGSGASPEAATATDAGRAAAIAQAVENAPVAPVAAVPQSASEPTAAPTSPVATAKWDELGRRLVALLEQSVQEERGAVAELKRINAAEAVV